jgi:hypothetical protein
MTSIKSSVDEFVDDRPFCEDCRGYTCGGLGAYEPVCCCDDSEDEEEYICDCSVCGERLYECGSVELAEDADGGGCCAKCAPVKENKPTIFEKLALPTPEEFELLPPDEKRLILIKTTALWRQGSEARAKANVVIVDGCVVIRGGGVAKAWVNAKAEEAKKKKPIKLKLKKKKPIKLKLKLKKEC